MLKSLAITAVSIFGVSSLYAQGLFTEGHGDIGVGYEFADMEFEPHWHLGDGAIVDGVPINNPPDGEEYEPANIIAVATSIGNSPSGSAGILGVADGTPIFMMGSDTHEPNLGLATEELDPGNWTGNITITLTSFTLPSATADFGLFSTNLAGDTVVDRIFSTEDPSATVFNNSLPMAPGGHEHWDWGFTEAGTYELTFTWTGTHNVHGNISTPATFTFNAVPEPSTIALVGLGVVGALALLRKRHRKE